MTRGSNSFGTRYFIYHSVEVLLKTNWDSLNLGKIIAKNHQWDKTYFIGWIKLILNYICTSRRLLDMFHEIGVCWSYEYYAIYIQVLGKSLNLNMISTLNTWLGNKNVPKISWSWHAKRIESNKEENEEELKMCVVRIS